MAQSSKNSKDDVSLIQKIDQALNDYYDSFEHLQSINKYSNEDGMGKFALFCAGNGIAVSVPPLCFCTTPFSVRFTSSQLNANNAQESRTATLSQKLKMEQRTACSLNSMSTTKTSTYSLSPIQSLTERVRTRRYTA